MLVRNRESPLTAHCPTTGARRELAPRRFIGQQRHSRCPLNGDILSVDAFQHGSQTVVLLRYREKPIANREGSFVACEISEPLGALTVARSGIAIRH